MTHDDRCLTVCFHHDSQWSNAQMIAAKFWVENLSEKRTFCPILQHNLKICLLLVVSRLFFACYRYVQVIVSCVLLVVGCFRLLLARCRSFQVVSWSLQVVPGRFLLVADCFRSFQVISCSLQVVSGRFRSFPHFNKYCSKIKFVCCTNIYIKISLNLCLKWHISISYWFVVR